MRFKIIQKIDEHFLREWWNLWTVSPLKHLFNSPNWFRVCIKTFKPSEYKIFALYDESDVLLAVYPVVETKRFGITFLSSPGGVYSDKSGLLLRNSKADLIYRFISRLKKQGNIIVSELEERFAKNMEKSKRVLMEESSFSPFLPTGSDPMRFFTQKNVRYTLRRLCRDGGDFKFVMQKENLIKHLDVAIEIENRSSKESTQKRVFDKKEVVNLYKNMIDIFGEKVILGILYKDELAIAYEIGFYVGNTFYASQKAYDDKYKDNFPGKVLEMLLINCLSGMGIELFDFARGIDVCKKDFTIYITKNYNSYLCKNYFIYYWIKLSASILHKIMMSPKLFEFLRIHKVRISKVFSRLKTTFIYQYDISKAV